MVTNGDVSVVGLESVLGTTEQDTNLEGVVVTGVKVSVVANLHGQVHGDAANGDQGLLLQGMVILQHSSQAGVVSQDALQLGTHAAMDGTAELSKGVKRRLGKRSGARLNGLELLRGLVGSQSLQVDNMVTDAHTSASFVGTRREDTKGQVVNGEVALAVGGDPRLDGSIQRHDD